MPIRVVKLAFVPSYSFPGYLPTKVGLMQDRAVAADDAVVIIIAGRALVQKHFGAGT
jgi:hypothetical protein